MQGFSSPALVLLAAVLLTGTISWKYVAALNDTTEPNPEVLEQPSDLEFVTFNTGLRVDDVPEYETRRDAFLDAVTNGSIPGDVVCLQEVWEADDLRAIVNAAVSQFPYSHSALHISDGVLSNASSTPACKEVAIANVVQCLNKYCLGSTGLQTVMCALSTCKKAFASLSQDCLSCLNRVFASFHTDNLTVAVVQARMKVCLVTPYPTTFGLLLLSKKPLVDPEVVNYHEGNSLILPRGYIKAKIEAYQLFCTQLVAQLHRYLYLEVGPFTNFAEQSLFEMDSLLKASKSSYVNSILIGDFNSNPAIPIYGIPGSLIDTYDLVSQWYFSPYLLYIGKCTYCAGNPLTPPLEPNKLYDHIFVPTCWWSYEKRKGVKRVLESHIPGQQFPLSDHYGVSVSYEKWSWQLGEEK
ncbi:uncharacterized protein LOC106151165 [Lingula anatina]|uniref:Uncharacterized protein LOC106151165 n=1 Tax=Lingula anatina TaxID=7574 RepID=A0A1S3H2M0_LINAN|nr:uncharacterized protein LOC106151165 [Lingula anatina]|eukprot:XP_013379726.1 uncharacterized protein LOC106151165 [Lingula anatina]